MTRPTPRGEPAGHIPNDSPGATPGEILVAAAPEGVDALFLAAQARRFDAPLLFVARDDGQAARMENLLAFADPSLRLLSCPAWDCLPYDRVSPNPAAAAARLRALCRLAAGAQPDIVIATVNGLLQRVPPAATLATAFFALKTGTAVERERLTAFLQRFGYSRVATVREHGEYALRGGIMDIFPAGEDAPLRLDFFGDQPESIRPFDPMTQRAEGAVSEAMLIPVSEAPLDAEASALFRRRYRELFGAVDGAEDPLYAALSEGRRHPGMEHWLPLLHERLETLTEYLPRSPVFLAPQAAEAAAERFADIDDYYRSRRDLLAGGGKKSTREPTPPYKPVPPQMMFQSAAEWTEELRRRTVFRFHPFQAPSTAGATVLDAGGRGLRDFSAERAAPEGELFAAVAARIRRAAPRRCLITATSEGALARLSALLQKQGIDATPVREWRALATLPPGSTATAPLELSQGFAVADATVYTETDILGERTMRPRRKRRSGAALIAELSALQDGDLVVHEDHGLGRYDGLETLRVDDAPHDCLRLLYAGGDRLYLPVENLELLSRFGGGDAAAQLDRLGAASWQARKAAAKQRIGEMAQRLMQVAAARMLRQGVALRPPEGLYAEFAARFPYSETADQQAAIDDVLSDMASGRPMDRLICGDVGFGKTEVAIRAAFVAAMEGRQVAVITPTTLLARQHYGLFRARFDRLPLRVEMLSRMTPPSQAAAIRRDLADGKLDIVIGTHALLGKSVHFDRLGLVVVDEEQHFGVAQKERLKDLKKDVHVLTMTATPIPRTLQMAVSGVRALSLIATPPVDRLAVRTFLTPYDPVVLREAMLRELRRGGQIYYVCPRLADLEKTRAALAELAPELRIAVAHGRMAPAALDETMAAFTDGRFDLLLSTNIVESGLDIPNANTMIIHRADMFGLAQLYQLRGRIGRGKQRAYCYLTTPPGRTLAAAAEKRLQALRALDSLGAGFTLASHDMDIRGAGNLLGEEQSGHVREVGVELYQRMLEEAMAALRPEQAADGIDGQGDGGGAAPAAGAAADGERWSPTISLGAAVLIPESYVADLTLRMELYRRLARLEEEAEIDAFAEELTDRFGPPPAEVKTLLRVIAVKQLCRRAGVASLKAGPKGAVVAFHGDFANPEGLIAYIRNAAGKVRLRPDHSLLVARDWQGVEQKLAGATALARKLAEIAAGKPSGR